VYVVPLKFDFHAALCSCSVVLSFEVGHYATSVKDEAGILACCSNVNMLAILHSCGVFSVQTIMDSTVKFTLSPRLIVSTYIEEMRKVSLDNIQCIK
jgi:hypothetical protein